MLSRVSPIALKSTSVGFSGTALRSSSVVSSSLSAAASSHNSISPAFAFAKLPQQRQQVKYFASDSHDDFAPHKKKAVDGEDEALAMIKEHVAANKVMLYMKGNPSMPMCGFSARVVEALQKEGVDFSSVNVLDYPAIREGVKNFSEWPTIPQLYVNGEFIGGCDIVLDMHASGELKALLEEAK